MRNPDAFLLDESSKFHIFLKLPGAERGATHQKIWMTRLREVWYDTGPAIRSRLESSMP